MTSYSKGRLTARPTKGQVFKNFRKGLRRLDVDPGKKDGLLYVPEDLDLEVEHPMIVLFHGAGGDAEQLVAPFRNLADHAGTILLGLDSRERTWDLVMNGGDQNGYGPDVEFVDKALRQVFDQLKIDPDRLAIGGFSDGASYSLSLGISNGDLFSHILAFSPGFMAPESWRGSPSVFLCHGTGDQVLPINRCGRTVAGQLKEAGLLLHYVEFDNGHILPPELVKEGFKWFEDPGLAPEISKSRVDLDQADLAKT